MLTGVDSPPIRVHYSQISAYRTCPRMYWFNYVYGGAGIIPKVEDKKLVFGKGIHKGIEAFYRTGSQANAMATYQSWLVEQRELLEANGADMNQVDKDAKTGTTLLGAYLSFAAENDRYFSVVSAEQPFSVPVLSPEGNDTNIRLVGTWDAVVKDGYGKLWLMEHKTARDAPTELELSLNLQVSYYTLAAHLIFEEGASGVVYNVLRKVDPSRARTPVIRRQMVTRSLAELAATKDQLYRAVKQMLQDEHYDPTPGHHCNWRCAYSRLCLCVQEDIEFTVLVEAHYLPMPSEPVDAEDPGEN